MSQMTNGIDVQAHPYFSEKREYGNSMLFMWHDGSRKIHVYDFSNNGHRITE